MNSVRLLLILAAAATIDIETLANGVKLVTDKIVVCGLQTVKININMYRRQNLLFPVEKKKIV